MSDNPTVSSPAEGDSGPLDEGGRLIAHVDGERPRQADNPHGKGRLPDDPDSIARRLAARQKAIAAGAHFKREWADAGYWHELARARGVTLPQWHTPCTPGKMGTWLGTLGIPTRAYLAWAGEPTLRQFAARNPAVPLRVWVCWLLEALEADAFADTEAAHERPYPRGAGGAVRCQGCGAGSGQCVDPTAAVAVECGEAIQAALRPKGWYVLHGGHLGLGGDARCWVCPKCAPTWRDGQALKDVARSHGTAVPS